MSYPYISESTDFCILCNNLRGFSALCSVTIYLAFVCNTKESSVMQRLCVWMGLSPTLSLFVVLVRLSYLAFAVVSQYGKWGYESLISVVAVMKCNKVCAACSTLSVILQALNSGS